MRRKVNFFIHIQAELKFLRDNPNIIFSTLLLILDPVMTGGTEWCCREIGTPQDQVKEQCVNIKSLRPQVKSIASRASEQPQTSSRHGYRFFLLQSAVLSKLIFATLNYIQAKQCKALAKKVKLEYTSSSKRQNVGSHEVNGEAGLQGSSRHR